MKICGLQKLTLLDFPTKTACTVFTGGCNLRCPFCHNASLVTGVAEAIDAEEFFAFLAKRKGLLQGVCISGGEPLLQKDIVPFINRIRDM
ncbi:MAG: radical SAM protein, partial [Deferribacterales bacterium]|nr:radical SAM protein [Deferribacterales bacterium]